MRIKTIAANWKANASKDGSSQLISSLLQGTWTEDRRVIVAVPHPYLDLVSALIDDSPISLAAQDCSVYPDGAYTGETTISMLKDLGVEYVIIGHSERRQYFEESDETLKSKLERVLASGLKAIFCIGERLEERKSEKHIETVVGQLSLLQNLEGFDPAAILLAYEPVWAIGTGETASPEQAEEMHLEIRGFLKDSFGQELADSSTILYGGSVKSSNANSLFNMPNIDGGLVGGASLDAEEFLKIINS